MKATIAALVLSLLGFYAVAQDSPADSTNQSETKTKEKRQRDDYEMKTLIGGDRKLAHGGYLGVSVLGTQMNDDDALLVGGRLAWVIDHWFSVGFAGYGLTNSISIPDPQFDSDIAEFGMGYGGLLLEPIVKSHLPVHLSFPVIVGAGGAGFFDNGVEYYDSDRQTWVSSRNEGDAFFVVEPGVDVEVNVMKYMRFAVGGSYRYVNQVNISGLSAEDLSGFSAGVTLKVGFF